jgi:steroid delta-isomerase-like uncharacterized protein
MDPLDAARRYFDAWNAHDPEAIAAALAPDGVYRDPTVPAGLGPAETGAYAAGLVAAFPDLAFAIEDEAASDGLVTGRWVMTGTNDGPFMGLPPTGLPIRVDGVDLIRVEGGRIRAVDGYFDTASLPRQLGLQVLVQPQSVGPFSFGVSTYVSKAGIEPGAMSLTVLEAPAPEHREEVRQRTREVVAELLATDGFVSWLGITVGDRMFTVTAWESPEAVEAVNRSPAHAEAARRFFGPEFAVGGQTGVWAPHRLNGLWARCPDCGEMVPAAGGRCSCGGELSPPRYW